MRELLLHALLEVTQPRVAEAIDVKQEVVKVQPLGSMQRPGSVTPDPHRSGVRSVPVERLGVVLVLGSVEVAAGRSGERRVEVLDGVVRFLSRRGRWRRRARGFGPAGQVRMYGPAGILELSDRPTGHVLDDRLQAPASAATRRAVRRRLPAHGPSPVPRGV
jgi:hypothetical protein